MSSARTLSFALLPAVLALASAGPHDAQEQDAGAVYAALIARHAEAAALDVVATVEQRLEPAGGGAPTDVVVIEGEAHMARPAAGWLRTSTVVLAGPDAPSETGETGGSDAGDAPGVRSYELVGDGEAIHEVDRRTRSVATLGGRWFALFPDVTPLVAWTGRRPPTPSRVEHVVDEGDRGRTGLRLTFGGDDAAEPRATELLWLDEEGRLVAAETARRTPEGTLRATLTFRAWRLSDEVDVEAYVRRPPVGFADRDLFASIEEAFLPVGAAAPEAELRPLGGAGEPLALSELRGEAVLLVFWFPDCPTCDEDLPRIQATWEELRLERDDVRFLGVAIGDEDGRSREAWEASGATYPTYGQHDDALSSAFGVRVYPSTFVLGKDGRVLWRSIGYDATAVRAILAATR